MSEKSVVADVSCQLFLHLGVLLYLISCSTADQTVPALYVFGDSLVDVGNNNYLPLSIVKADFPHNGIDYPGKKITGRFSNGKNAADFIAEKLGIPSAPPYLSQPNSIFLKGVNFASGGAGIFNATEGGIVEQTISLAKQVSHFSTVCGRLVQELGSTTAEEHLSKSLFPIVIGSNDIIGHFKSASPDSNKTLPQQYIALMLSTLRQLLKGLHGLGGRKFLFVGLPPLGCAPKQRSLGNNKTDECNEQVNFWSNEYNRGFTQMLQQLKLELSDFHYSYFDTYTVFLDFIRNPAAYALVYRIQGDKICLLWTWKIEGSGSLHAYFPILFKQRRIPFLGHIPSNGGGCSELRRRSFQWFRRIRIPDHRTAADSYMNSIGYSLCIMIS